MIKNYIRIAFRNLLRHKLFSLVTIFGLAAGLAVCLLVMTYTLHELSFDRFHRDAKKTFAIHVKAVMGKDTVQMPYTSYATGPLIRNGVPGVTAFLRMQLPNKPLIIRNPENPAADFSEKGLVYADSSFFHFFSFPLLSGDATSALKQPFSVVLSEASAKKYFGTTDAIGKTLAVRTADSLYSFHVTAIAKNVPSNSSIRFDFVASTASFPLMKENKWMSDSQVIQGGALKTYVKLDKPSRSYAVETAIRKLAQKDGRAADVYVLTSLPDMHLKANFGDYSNQKYLKIFPLVAGLILLLALINYMSLTTARAAVRAREVGVRKAIGASKERIAQQFYVESAVSVTLSFLAGIVIFIVIKPAFFNLLQLPIDVSFLYGPFMVTGVAALFAFTVLIAGLYPSFVLSAYKPVAVLYGRINKNAAGITVRKFMTTFQFAISVLLIVCGIVIDRQLYFFRHKDTGVNRENVVMIPVPPTMHHYQAFKKDVSALSVTAGVATAHYPMYQGYDMFFTKLHGDDVELPVFSVDRSFIKTMGLQWRVQPLDTTIIAADKQLILNEAAVSRLELGADARGKFADISGTPFQVAGVLRDFNFETLQQKIKPLALFIAPDTTNGWEKAGACLFVRTRPGSDMSSFLASAGRIFNAYDKETPFAYQFVDEAFNNMYQAEDRLAGIFTWLTVLTVVIASLGLFALAAFTVEQRTREIGIRKVLGASAGRIAVLLSGDSLKLTLVAIVAACPLAWWFMHNWLENFEYRIDISWWMFGAAAILSLFVATVTVSFHTVRAAIAKPVKNLRTE